MVDATAPSTGMGDGGIGAFDASPARAGSCAGWNMLGSKPGAGSASAWFWASGLHPCTSRPANSAAWMVRIVATAMRMLDCTRGLGGSAPCGRSGLDGFMDFVGWRWSEKVNGSLKFQVGFTADGI